MDQELKDLKSVLRSIVVSSPTQMSVRTLLRDYRSMMGAPLPLLKYGYRDPLTFLRERCADCFLLTGLSSDPVLTLIVPETLKHIDQFVQKQRLASTVKHKGKRRSIPEQSLAKQNLVTNTIVPKSVNTPKNSNSLNNTVQNSSKSQTKNNNDDYKITSPPVNITRKPLLSTPVSKPDNNYKESNKHSTTNNTDIKYKETYKNRTTNITDNGSCSRDAVQNFLKKRLPIYDSSHYLNNEKKYSDDKSSLRDDDDSGRQTSSSNSIIKAAKLEELKVQIRDLVAEYPEGVWCTDLIRLYRERFGRELNYSRFGYTSILSLVCVLDELCVTRPLDTGDWLLTVAASAPASASASACHRPAPRRLLRAPRPPTPVLDAEDALPGIGFDGDVFPEDVVALRAGIPASSVADVAVGALLEVMVGEVYSPSHFWLIRRGDNYNIAMENIMDEMNEYYKWGEGKDRVLPLGAVCVGHYCSAVYDGDWHRSVIVRLMDSDTVKVRHVDYGTVDTVRAGALRPLLARWARLPAQAVRARLAAVRPPAAGRRWPRPAAAAFLARVRDAALVADVAAVDAQESILEVYLVDTSTDDDVCISAELVRAGHADPRQDSALRAEDWHLFPRFAALEGGLTPNYGEIHAYLRDGIALEYVDDYRRHVPSCWPQPSPPTSTSPPASSSPPASVTPPPSPPASPEPPTPLPVDLIDFPVSEPQHMPVVTPEPCPAPAPPPAAPPAPAPALAPAPAPAAAPGALNRVPLLQPPPPPRGPGPRGPCPPMLPVQQYPGFAPYPGPMPMYHPPMFPAPMPMMVPQPYGSVPPGFAPLPPRPPPPRPPMMPTWRDAPTPPSTMPTWRDAPTPPSTMPTWRGAPSPPPGGAGPRPKDVTLTVSECEIYRLLSEVDGKAAHWYMADAIARALRSPRPPGLSRSSLNPEAAEFRVVSASTQTLARPRRPPSDSSE